MRKNTVRRKSNEKKSSAFFGKFLQFIQIVITPLLTNFHFLKNKLEAHEPIGIDDDYNEDDYDSSEDDSSEDYQ